MSSAPFAYYAPETLDQALELLGSNSSVRVLAGGHQLVPVLARRELRADMLVDLRRVNALHGIRPTGDGVILGAMTRLQEIAQLPALVGSALSDAIEALGDHETRLQATIGGSVASLEAANDVLSALSVHGAAVECATPGGNETVGLETLLRDGLPKSAIIVAIRLPDAAPSTGSAHVRVRDPASLYPICAVSVSLRRDSKGRVKDPVVAVTGATEKTCRLSAAEEALDGQSFPPVLERPVLTANDCVSDHVSGAEYRALLGNELVRRAVSQAASRVAR